MNAISDTLFHFIGKQHKEDPNEQFNIFKMIIENGLKLGNVEFIVGDQGFVKHKGICFTDIPLNFCDDHTAFYGKFAIGFKKSFVKDVGGNPARYFVDYHNPLVPNNPTARGLLFTNIRNIFSKVLALNKKCESSDSGIYDKNNEEIFSKKEIHEFYSHFVQLFSFDKPCGDLGPVRDGAAEMDIFYKEREWRIIQYEHPVNIGLINKVGDEYLIPFSRENIRIVIVPNDEIKNKVNDYFINLNYDDKRLKTFRSNLVTVINYDDIKHI